MKNLDRFNCITCGMRLSEEPHIPHWRQEFLQMAYVHQLDLTTDCTGMYRDDFTRGLWSGWVISHHYCEHKVKRSPR